MPTQPLFDDPWSYQEYQARVQMKLDDSWTMSVISYGVPVGLEGQVERLDQDSNLSDEERWQELNDNLSDVAWLPEDVILVTMVQKDNPGAGTRSGFVNLGGVRGPLNPADAGNDPQFE